MRWDRASFEQLCTTVHIAAGMHDLPVHDVEYVALVRRSAPGIALAAIVLHPLKAA